MKDGVRLDFKDVVNVKIRMEIGWVVKKTRWQIGPLFLVQPGYFGYVIGPIRLSDIDRAGQDAFKTKVLHLIFENCGNLTNFFRLAHRQRFGPNTLHRGFYFKLTFCSGKFSFKTRYLFGGDTHIPETT